MKLTTQRLKKLIHEELQNVKEAMTFKKTGVEKVKDPDTGEVIVIDHDNEVIKVVGTNRQIVYEPDFATNSPISYERVDLDKFIKKGDNEK